MLETIWAYFVNLFGIVWLYFMYAVGLTITIIAMRLSWVHSPRFFSKAQHFYTEPLKMVNQRLQIVVATGIFVGLGCYMVIDTLDITKKNQPQVQPDNIPVISSNPNVAAPIQLAPTLPVAQKSESVATSTISSDTKPSDINTVQNATAQTTEQSEQTVTNKEPQPEKEPEQPVQLIPGH